MAFKFEKLIVWQKAFDLSGHSNLEFNKFLGYALRSNVEVVGCLHLAKKRKYITDSEFTELYSLCEEILVMINALRNSLK
jgi:four helix bundle protein